MRPLGRPAAGANVVGLFDVSAVPASSAMGSNALKLLLCCNTYCNILDRADRCFGRAFRHASEPRCHRILAHNLAAEPSLNLRQLHREVM
jgi:hypothetical protein